MAKKPTPKPKGKESNPLGDLMTPEFIEKSFKKAVKKVWEQNRQKGLDYYGTIDGKIVAVKAERQDRTRQAQENQRLKRRLMGHFYFGTYTPIRHFALLCIVPKIVI
jgi:hypothetical protein